MRATVLRWLLLAGLLGPVAGAGLLVPGPAPALADGPQVRIVLDSTAFPTLLATITVLDEAGRPVVGLGPESFQASVDGRPLAVSQLTSATDAGLGISVVLAFDASGSMAGYPLEQAKQAGKALIEQLGPADQVAVLSFAETVQVVQGFTADRQALGLAVDSLTASGNTALYDGIATAAQAAAQAPLARKALLLLSDGRDFGGVSATSREASLAAAQAAGVPVFAIGLGDSFDGPYLEGLAAASRGQLLQAEAAGALTGLYQTIGSILRHQYLLVTEASGLTPGSTAVFRVSVAQAGVTATAESSLAVPGAPPAPPPPPPPAPPVSAPVLPEAEPSPAPQEEGGGPPLALLALPVLVVAAVLGVAFVRRRRRRRGPEIMFRRTLVSAMEAVPAAAPSVQGRARAPERARAWLHVAGQASRRSYPLGTAPVTIGFTPDCDVRLPDGEGQGGERVRVWPREDHYMLHNLSRRGRVAVAGQGVAWAVLEEGDEIQVGACRLVFRLSPPAAG